MHGLWTVSHLPCNASHHGGCSLNSQDKLIKHGGEQCLKVDGFIMPLVAVDGSTLQLPVRLPTDAELSSAPCVVLCHACPSTVRRKSTIFDPGFRHPSNSLLNATINATTQLADSPLEAESCIISQQHCSQQAPALAVLRLPGRTDTNPFFCSIKSVRGYIIVQLLVHVPSSWILIFFLRKKKHALSALGDFIWSRGAPNKLISDCLGVQQGEAWRKITQKFVIDHTFTSPHNQNQNHAKNRIGKLKAHTYQILWQAQALTQFGCYAFEFAVDPNTLTLTLVILQLLLHTA